MSTPPRPVVMTRTDGTTTRYDAVGPSGGTATAHIRSAAGPDETFADRIAAAVTAAEASGVSSRTVVRTIGPVRLTVINGYDLPAATLRVGFDTVSRGVLCTLHLGTRGWAIGLHHNPATRPETP